MRVLYEAGHLLDAYLVRNALAEADIPVFVRGEYLVGALGELPMQGLLQVCVPEAFWSEAETCLSALGLGQGPETEVGQDGLEDGLPA